MEKYDKPGSDDRHELAIMRNISLCVFIVLAVFISASCSFFGAGSHSLAYAGDSAIVLDGKTYTLRDDYYWRPVEKGRKLGMMPEWKGWSLMALVVQPGVFSVKGDDGLTALYVQPPESEFDFVYFRSDVELPELKAENFSRIERVKESYPPIHHKACSDGVTDQAVIKDVISLILYQESKSVTSAMLDGASSSDTILLYSDQVPGCALFIPLWQMNGEYWLAYHGEERLVQIDKELLAKLSSH